MYIVDNYVHACNLAFGFGIPQTMRPLVMAPTTIILGILGESMYHILATFGQYRLVNAITSFLFNNNYWICTVPSRIQ